MFIIVEGIDRVGKTTFCNEFVKAYPQYKIFKETERLGMPKEMHMYANYSSMQSILNVLKCTGEKNIVFDRFHLSEYVYGRLERGYDGLAYYESINAELNKLGNEVLLVYVRPTDLYESSLEHGKDLSEHAKMFDSLVSNSSLYKLSFTYIGIADAVEDLKAWGVICCANGIHEDGCGWAPDGTFCGECSMLDCSTCGVWKGKNK